MKDKALTFGLIFFGKTRGFQILDSLGCAKSIAKDYEIMQAIQLEMERVSSQEGCLTYGFSKMLYKDAYYTFHTLHTFTQDYVKRDSYLSLSFVLKNAYLDPYKIINLLHYSSDKLHEDSKLTDIKIDRFFSESDIQLLSDVDRKQNIRREQIMFIDMGTDIRKLPKFYDLASKYDDHSVWKFYTSIHQAVKIEVNKSRILYRYYYKGKVIAASEDLKEPDISSRVFNDSEKVPSLSKTLEGRIINVEMNHASLKKKMSEQIQENKKIKALIAEQKKNIERISNLEEEVTTKKMELGTEVDYMKTLTEEKKVPELEERIKKLENKRVNRRNWRFKSIAAAVLGSVSVITIGLIISLATINSNFLSFLNENKEDKNDLLTTKQSQTRVDSSVNQLEKLIKIYTELDNYDQKTLDSLTNEINQLEKNIGGTDLTNLDKIKRWKENIIKIQKQYLENKIASIEDYIENKQYRQETHDSLTNEINSVEKIIKDMKNKNIGVTNEDIEDWKTSMKSIKKKGVKKTNNTKPKYRQIASFAKNQDKISNIAEKHKNVKNTVDDIIKSIRENNKSNVGNSSVVSTDKDSTKIIFYLKQ